MGVKVKEFYNLCCNKVLLQFMNNNNIINHKNQNMKKVFLLTFLSLALVIGLQAQTAEPVAQNTAQTVTQTPQYKVITVVESIVPGGLGRSRMIENKSDLNIDDFTTERTDGKKSNQGDVRRKDAKVDYFAESKMLNFYSITGINFQNIASNDALMTSKLNQMAEEGWELMFVTSGVETHAGEPDDGGIFITRFIFKK